MVAEACRGLGWPRVRAREGLASRAWAWFRAHLCSPTCPRFLLCSSGGTLLRSTPAAVLTGQLDLALCIKLAPDRGRTANAPDRSRARPAPVVADIAIGAVFLETSLQRCKCEALGCRPRFGPRVGGVIMCVFEASSPRQTADTSVFKRDFTCGQRVA